MDYPTDPSDFDLCIARAKVEYANRGLDDADTSINSLMVWHSGKFDVERLSRFTELTSLRVAGWYGDSLDALINMPKLEHLFIYMLPHITSFEPLSKLNELRHVEFSINHWADLQDISSFSPFGKLQHLSYLRLYGFEPKDKDLSSLLAAPSLKVVELAYVFTLEQLSMATQQRPDLADCFKPVIPHEVECLKCGNHMVYLQGLVNTRRKRNLCSHCNRKRISEHQTEFDELFSSK